MKKAVVRVAGLVGEIQQMANGGSLAEVSVARE
jgi:hypothetical protein